MSQIGYTLLEPYSHREVLVLIMKPKCTAFRVGKRDFDSVTVVKKYSRRIGKNQDKELKERIANVSIMPRDMVLSTTRCLGTLEHYLYKEVLLII